MSEMHTARFEIVWIDYKCGNNHALRFGHLVTKRGKFESGSPAMCMSCMSSYNFAEIIEPTKYYEFRKALGMLVGSKRQKTAHSR